MWNGVEKKPNASGGTEVWRKRSGRKSSPSVTASRAQMDGTFDDGKMMVAY